MNKSKLSILALVLPLFFFSCGDDDSTEEATPEVEVNESTTIIQESFFNSSSLVSFETVTADLEDGTSATCYQLTFSSNPVESGPYCPETTDDIGGMGIYDGNTGAGLRVFAEGLLNDIETDGFDMVDENGNVNIEDFSGGNPDLSISNCLDALPDDDLQLVFTIPVTPKFANSNNDIGEVELVGVSLDGVSINGAPPSATLGPEMLQSNGEVPEEINMPSLDPCGGHHDPSGYYHWHLIPEVANQVLASALPEDERALISCTNIEQTDDVVLSGFAKDGYPIYAYATVPDGVDECGGITAATTEYPEGVYHYIASTTVAPNVPVCLKGVAARDAFTFR